MLGPIQKLYAAQIHINRMLFKCSSLLHNDPIYNFLSHQKELIKAFATTIENQAFLISNFYQLWSATVCKPVLKNGYIREL